MNKPVEEQLDELRREVAELREKMLGLTPLKKDWMSTFGTLQDDELSRAAERLGREYREAQREP